MGINCSKKMKEGASDILKMGIVKSVADKETISELKQTGIEIVRSAEIHKFLPVAVAIASAVVVQVGWGIFKDLTGTTTAPPSPSPSPPPPAIPSTPPPPITITTTSTATPPPPPPPFCFNLLNPFIVINPPPTHD